MAGNAGPTLKHPDGAEDMSLFHRQHPSTPPPRFSSPSRLQSRRTKVELAFKTAANRAATSTLLQGIVWTALSVLAILLHYGWLPVTDPKEEIDKWDSWEFIMYNLYFKENAVMPGLPHEGIVSATQMLYFAIATLAANFLMLFLSFVLMARLCGGASPRADLAAVVMWAVSVIVVTTVDVLVAAAMARDLVLFLGSWEPSWPGNVTALRRCPGAILALALRGGVLLLANVTCMLVVLRRLHEHRNKADRASQAATKADGPIDGFLYRSGDKEGVNNPVFVPDDAGQPWTTFKPEEHAAQRANGHRGHDLGYLSKDDPEDISHLMWMEEVDKHVDVHMRRGRVEDRRPQHHRYGFVEDRHLGHVIPSGRLSLRAAVGPLPPGPLPVGYPDPNTSQGLRLSRVALAEPPSHALYALSQPPSQTHFQAPSHALSRGPSQTHFQAPSHALSQAPYQTYFQAPSQAPSHALFQPLSQAPALPPVDYSPRARRRGDGGAAARAADRALAAGRANLHPVRQDRY